MKPSFSRWNQRTFDLAIENTTVGLDRAGVEDLELQAKPHELEELELAAAAILLGHLSVEGGPSARLIASLESAGRRAVNEKRS